MIWNPLTCKIFLMTSCYWYVYRIKDSNRLQLVYESTIELYQRMVNALLNKFLRLSEMWRRFLALNWVCTAGVQIKEFEMLCERVIMLNELDFESWVLSTRNSNIILECRAMYRGQNVRCFNLVLVPLFRKYTIFQLQWSSNFFNTISLTFQALPEDFVFLFRLCPKKSSTALPLSTTTSLALPCKHVLRVPYHIFGLIISTKRSSSLHFLTFPKYLAFLGCNNSHISSFFTSLSHRFFSAVLFMLCI